VRFRSWQAEFRLLASTVPSIREASLHALAQSRELLAQVESQAHKAKGLDAKSNSPIAEAEMANLEKTIAGLQAQLRMPPGTDVPDHWLASADAGSRAVDDEQGEKKKKKKKKKKHGDDVGKTSPAAATGTLAAAPEAAPLRAHDDRIAYQVQWNSRGLDGGSLQDLLQRTSQQLDEMKNSSSAHRDSMQKQQMEMADANADVEQNTARVLQHLGRIKADLEVC